MSQCEWEPSCRRHPLIRRASVTIPRYGPHSLGCKTQLPLPVAHRRLRLEHSIQTRRKVLVLQFSMNRPCLASTVAKRLVLMNRCHAGPAIQPYPLTKLFTRPPYCVEPRGVLSSRWRRMVFSHSPLVCCRQLARVRTGIGRTGPYK